MLASLSLVLFLHAARAQDPAATCGALALPAADAPSADLLDGFLRLPMPPGAARSEIPHAVMGPPVPDGEGTLWFVDAGGDRMGLFAQRMHVLATDSFPDDLFDMLDPTLHRAELVGTDGTRGVAWWGDVAPSGGADVRALDVMWALRNGELVQTSFLLDDATASHGDACTRYALAWASRIAAGLRDEPLTAHRAVLPLTGRRSLSLDVPDRAVLVSRPGPDFSVFQLSLLSGLADGYAGATLYVGAHPQEILPGNAPGLTGRVAGRAANWIVQQTPDGKRRSLETIVPLDRSGLQLHVAIEGSLDDTIRLRERIERARVVRAPPPAPDERAAEQPPATR